MRSTTSAPIKAVCRLENPDEQNPLGKVLPLPYPAAAEADHNCPPLSHSQVISLSLNEKCT